MSRGFSVTPSGVDILLALSQRPDGARLSELAHIIEAPLTSVQSALRTLTSNGIVVRRADGRRPVYRADPDHPAHAELLRLAWRFAEPSHAIEILLRANEAIVSAWRDNDGFVTAEREEPDGSSLLLSTALDEVRRDRVHTPAISTFESTQLSRLVQVALDLRTRLSAATVVKGPDRRGRGARSGAPVPARRATPSACTG